MPSELRGLKDKQIPRRKVAGDLSDGGVSSAVVERIVSNTVAAPDGVTIDALGASGTLEVRPLGIGTAQLAAASVTTAKLQDASVTTAKLVDASVTTAKIADLSVATAQLNAYSVTTAKLVDASVTTAKIQDGAVTDAKEGTRVADPTYSTALSPANTGTLTQLFSWIVRQIKALSGATLWTDAPATAANTVATVSTLGHVRVGAGLSITSGSIQTAVSYLYQDSAGNQTLGKVMKWGSTGYTATDSNISQDGNKGGISGSTLAAVWDVNLSDSGSIMRARQTGSGQALTVALVNSLNSSTAVDISSNGTGICVNIAASGTGGAASGLRVFSAGGAAVIASTSGNNSVYYGSRTASTATTSLCQLYQLSPGDANAVLETQQDGSGMGLKHTHNGSATPTTTSNNHATYFNGTTRVARLTRTGTWFAAGYTTGGADFAEAWEFVGSRASYVFGDVLVMDPTTAGRVRKLQVGDPANRVIGVYRDPALVGLLCGAESEPGGWDEGVDGVFDGLRNRISVARNGFVVVNVCDDGGAIAMGDVLVPCTTVGREGYAMKGTPGVGEYIGKAWGTLASGTATIQAVINVS